MSIYFGRGLPHFKKHRRCVIEINRSQIRIYTKKCTKFKLSNLIVDGLGDATDVRLVDLLHEVVLGEVDHGGPARDIVKVVGHLATALGRTGLAGVEPGHGSVLGGREGRLRDLEPSGKGQVGKGRGKKDKED